MATATEVYEKMNLKELIEMRRAFEADLKDADTDDGKDFIIGRLYIVNWFIQQQLSTI